MIKIIEGVYGLRVGKTVRPVTVGDGAIEIGKDQEARLVKLGIAVYAETEQEYAPVAKEKRSKKGSTKTDIECDDGLPELNAEDPVDEE